MPMTISTLMLPLLPRRLSPPRLGVLPPLLRPHLHVHALLHRVTAHHLLHGGYESIGNGTQDCPGCTENKNIKRFTNKLIFIKIHVQLAYICATTACVCTECPLVKECLGSMHLQCYCSYQA